MFNVEDVVNDERLRGKYAHIVGNGTADDARSNAHTLDWDGNAWFAGDVYVDSTSGTDKDDGSKKLATEEYVDDAVSGFSSKVFQIAASTDENLNTNLFLLDNADNMILKYYNGTSWVPVTIGWG